jgi:hypothetical protein
MIAIWINAVTKFGINLPANKEALLNELESDEEKLAFENTDGARALDEVAEICMTPRDTLYGWWKKWSALGILEPSETAKG